MIPLILLLCIGGMMHAVRSFTGGVSVGGIELAFGFLLLSAYFAIRIASRHHRRDLGVDAARQYLESYPSGSLAATARSLAWGLEAEHSTAGSTR